MQVNLGQPVELLAGHAREVELVGAEAAVRGLRVAVVVQLSLRVAAQDVPRRVECRRMGPEGAVGRFGPAMFKLFKQLLIDSSIPSEIAKF